MKKNTNMRFYLQSTSLMLYFNSRYAADRVIRGEQISKVEKY